VLCEKPVSGVLSELESLIEKRNKTGSFVMVGFQWSYSEGIKSLKRDILSGRFGKPLRMKSLCMWPRTMAYFSRNNWAYKVKDTAGNLVMDNLFNNAMSHFIHNMFYLLGDEENSSAGLADAEAIVARANNIETYDTGAVRAFTDSGVELLFLATHACEKPADPCFRIEFEKGFVELKSGGGEIVAKMINREVITYPSPDSDHQFRKLFEAIANVKNPGKLSCPPEATLSHSKLVHYIGENCGTTGLFADNLIVNDGERVFVRGLDDILLSCYRDFRMPGEELLKLRNNSL
jgi:predicted dehydrogenase